MAELQDILDSGTLTDLVLANTYIPDEAKGMMTKNLSDVGDQALQIQIDNLTTEPIDGGSF